LAGVPSEALSHPIAAATSQGSRTKKAGSAREKPGFGSQITVELDDQTIRYLRVLGSVARRGGLSLGADYFGDA
jgi:hypothetical protein